MLDPRYSFDTTPLKGDVALEIEVETEGCEAPYVDTDVWHSINEGSLRNNGKEYLFVRPIEYSHQEILKQVTYLSEKINDYCKMERGYVELSDRTSVHVHVNVGRKQPYQIYNQAVFYWLYETYFSRHFGGESRLGNLFCLRLKDAEGMTGFLDYDLSNGARFRSYEGGLVKYSGQNLAAVFQKGSLEYRVMKGNLDANFIAQWVEVLHTLSKKTEEFDDPCAILDACFERGPKKFLIDVLGKDIVNKIPIMDEKDFEDEVYENSFILSPCIYAQEWDNIKSRWQQRRKEFNNG